MPKIQPRVLPFQKKEEVTPSALALHQHTIRRLRAEIKRLHSRINKLERDREVITRPDPRSNGGGGFSSCPDLEPRILGQVVDNMSWPRAIRKRSFIAMRPTR